MILRRITDAFREQDWFTVVVETLIVVLDEVRKVRSALEAEMER